MSELLPLAVLQKLWPHGNQRVPGLVEGIAASAPAVFARYGIASPLTVAVMMAQFSHECGAGLEMVENIHYTALRACQIWPGRFRSESDLYAKIGASASDPEFHIKLMDSVYGGRMGNRVGTHDGSTFIGRGLSQCTGREGYEKVAAKTGLDVLNHPDLLSSPQHALECGVADFVICGCLPFAEKGDIVNTTKRLNGGLIGIAEREQWTARWRAALAAPGAPANPVDHPPQPAPPADHPPAKPVPAPAVPKPAPKPPSQPRPPHDQQDGGGS